MNPTCKKLVSARGKRKRQLAVLVDPDKFNPDLIRICDPKKVSYFFVGGSRLETGDFEKTITEIKKITDIPVVIFPGDEEQISSKADCLLLLSLLSGRNAEYLIGKHVKAAPIIRRKKIDCVPTAYILVDGNRKSETQRVTGTSPLHTSKEIIHTAIAAALLGFKLIYLEAGSGAAKALDKKLISAVHKNVDIPLLVGGGIDSAHKAKAAFDAGASIVVVGNALERNPDLIHEISSIL